MIIVQRQYQVSAYSGSRRSPKTSARPLGPVSTHLSSGPIPDSGHRCFLTFFCNRAQIGTSRILERDRQVKVSGYRIELGDVEENLRALPTVSDAVVLPVMQKVSPSRLPLSWSLHGVAWRANLKRECGCVHNSPSAFRHTCCRGEFSFMMRFR